MVLLRTATVFQPNRCTAVPDPPRIAEACAGHHQPAARCGATASIRGVSLRPPQCDLAAGIRRVKGVKKIGVRLGYWLLPDQAMALLDDPDPGTMKGKRDLALLAILVACGPRRHKAVHLNVSDPQRRQ
jgi:integrase